MSDELTPEQAEIIRNARAAYKAHKIDRWQLWSVYLTVARAIAEAAGLDGGS